MKEKELRFALVCYGGVSLAIYMHGITKEILKLVRASSALHAIPEREKRSGASFAPLADSSDPEHDSEAIYFDLLRELGRKIDLRVVVDIIAGASAGGINGTMLARALSHDLPTARLRDLWLDHADVSELLAPEARARGWSKWFLRPLFWAIGASRSELVRDAEVRSKLSMFVRSRWFKPPLDGMRMAGLMYEAVTAMGSPKSAEASLLPSGLGLDLFVTVTDYYGYQQPVHIHDPAIIQERVHRHLFHFKYRRRANGEVESDFDLANAPALAFAARATSSIPGAFPPARIVEIDELVRSQAAAWPHRADFIRRNFRNYLETDVDPACAPFIDGSVLNNRPFREAIRAIRGRPAYREVDRRIVYIDPDPAPPGARARDRMPGFFAMLKGALSDIPRAEPVADELSWVNSFNERARRLKAIIERARPQISRMVANVMTGANARITEAQIRRWRQRANVRAAHDGGFAYEGYVGLKLASARAFLSQLITGIRGVRPGSPFARAIAEVVDAWAARVEAVDRESGAGSFRSGAAQGLQEAPGWVNLLLGFDIDYRKRRLHFLIEGQNRLYQMLDAEPFSGIDAGLIDRLKRKFYDALDALQQRENFDQFDQGIRDLVAEIFPQPPSADEVRNIGCYAESAVARHAGKIDGLVERLAASIDLAASTRDIDLVLVEAFRDGWPRQASREVLINYLGFPFWDVLTFPVMTWREIGEFNELLVDRISVHDARALKKVARAQKIKGIAFEHTAAFLSRAYRENDYLLGRLHALDRLLDIVCDSAGVGIVSESDLLALKKRGFIQILDAEAPHLPNSRELIAELRASVAALAAQPEAGNAPELDRKKPTPDFYSETAAL
ncbi:MAG TPA: patatin-like protein [Xanthobacteraceae bacterium]|nr:patatin-like protein [Xanthobacteraceae bacterium]